MQQLRRWLNYGSRHLPLPDLKGQHRKAGWEKYSSKGARKNKSWKSEHVAIFVLT